MDEATKKWCTIPDKYKGWKLEFYNTVYSNPSRTHGYGMIGKVIDNAQQEFRILINKANKIACECNDFNGINPINEQIKNNGCQHIQFFCWATTAALNMDEKDYQKFFEEKNGEIFNDIIKVSNKNVKEAFKELEQFF